MYQKPLKISSVLALVALAHSSAVMARHVSHGPRCWSVPQITAAKINEFYVMLNVLSLRCRNEIPTLPAQYDRFRQDGQWTMKTVVKTVQGHFSGSGALYDNYDISVANKYGAGVKGQSCTNVVTLLQSALDGAHSLPMLSQAAETANIDPTLPGGACPLHPAKSFSAKSRHHHK